MTLCRKRPKMEVQIEMIPLCLITHRASWRTSNQATSSSNLCEIPFVLDLLTFFTLFIIS
jgi:hypothetical protein